VSVLIVIAQNGIDDLSVELFTASPRAVLIGNTVGQFIGLGLLVWLWTRLHVRRPASFLRVRRSDLPLLFWSVAGLVMLFPVVQWLGSFSESLPWPDAIREFDQAQVALIEEMLGSGQTGVIFNLFTLAVTPALCEELMFRGYIQRQFERSIGVVWSIMLTGAIFGLYHIRFTQAIPLAVLGIYLAYVTWKTGSLWPAVAVHLANNGFAVIASAYVAADAELDMDAIEHMYMPWYLVVGGLMFFALIIRQMDRRSRELQAVQRGANV
jgi:hypothetical protein